jgi:P-type Cu+ transporter
LRQAAQAAQKAASAKDPVCGKDVCSAASPRSEYRGRTQHFCSDRCKREFDKDPARYTENKPAQPSAGMSAGTAG